MTRGQALNKALKAAGEPSTFTKWRDCGTSLHTVTNDGSSAGQGERNSAHPSKSPPRHLGPGRRWLTALQHRSPGDGANAPTAPTATHPGFNP